MTPRRVSIVTGGRAEYGILYWLMHELETDDRFDLRIIVTGSHLSPEFGLTYRAIEADGLRIARKIEVLLSSDTATGVSKAVGLGVIGFADALADLDPDVLVVLGDRFEVFAAAVAALFAGIPIAHISGGELTLASVDDALRHCLSKLARYHFVAAEAYRHRVIQMGESPDRVFNVGDPGLDSIARMHLMDRDALSHAIGLDLSAPYLLVTYHPLTTGRDAGQPGLRALTDALDRFPDHRVVFTKPNADAGGRVLRDLIDAYAAARPGRVKAFTSLGQLRYLSAMRHCAAVVGNSSSGIVEAPAMGKPTVNVGLRQEGRLKAASIIDSGESADEIEAALRRALSRSFAGQAAHVESLYGNCSASSRIRELLATLDLSRDVSKTFHDLGE